ncbi:MAG: DUF4388 domain-containing protein [Proteobacteria bacterium]|nr:DUF4388 domain-containing protein [Pseudomonadota bacterium]MBU1059215.1 DUF4388 domain-containing protein [Pseudomonadota bacterium]
MLKKIVNYISGRKKTENKFSAHEDGIHLHKKCDAFQGDLSVVTIENVMQLMSHAGLSGELSIDTAQNAAIFVIDKGTLAFGYLKSQSFKIGERLLEKGYITPENLQECLQVYRAQSEKPKFGTFLIDKGFLRHNDLEETLKEQVKDIFFEVLSWKEGSFVFCVSDCASSEDIRLEERIDHLILMGIIQMENKM